MAFYLAHALLSNPLACFSFWLLGLVLGSLSRWFGALSEASQKLATGDVPAKQASPAVVLTPPSRCPSEDDLASTKDDDKDASYRPPSVTGPDTPPPLSPRTRASLAQHPHAALPAPRHPWYIHDHDARHVISRVAAQDEGQEAGWAQMMTKQVTHRYTYTAHRRSLPTGLTEYRTVTTFADTTPVELMEFLLDDSARKQWEGFLTSVDVCLTGDWLGGREQVVRWVRRFPFHFLSDREYVMARKVWVVGAAPSHSSHTTQSHTPGQDDVTLLPFTAVTPGAPLVAVTKGLDSHHAIAPVSPSLVRTQQFNSSWVCRACEDPWGREGVRAAQVVLLHSEAIQIPEYLARTAVSMGMGKFVKDLTHGLEAFRTARRAHGVPPHSLDLEAYGHDHTSDTIAAAEHHTVDTLVAPPHGTVPTATDATQTEPAPAAAAAAGALDTGAGAPVPRRASSSRVEAMAEALRLQRISAGGGGSGNKAVLARGVVRLALLAAAGGAAAAVLQRRKDRPSSTGLSSPVSWTRRRGRNTHRATSHRGGMSDAPVSLPHGRDTGLVAHALSDDDRDSYTFEYESNVAETAGRAQGRADGKGSGVHVGRHGPAGLEFGSGGFEGRGVRSRGSMLGRRWHV